MGKVKRKPLKRAPLSPRGTVNENQDGRLDEEAQARAPFTEGDSALESKLKTGSG